VASVLQADRESQFLRQTIMQEKIMPINKIFGGTISLTGKALDFRLERQGLIQSNIANMETPGYRVQDLPFARVMETAVSGQDKLTRTHPGHLSARLEEAKDSRRFSEEDRPVDLDEEMVKLAENQLMYQVAARLAAKKFEGLHHAIDEGGK
jgi:flagellar basal-body rod protein FlgB